VAAVEPLVSGPVPTRWVTQVETQLADAERRMVEAARHLAAGSGGRAIAEAYPGVMAAAIVRVWLRDEPWHTQRSHQELTRMMREELPNGFLTLFEMQGDQRNFAGWRAEDARPLIEEARTFTAETRAAVDSWQKRSPTT
jgi:hypothetical protein